jgi:hypothetical protein
MKKKWLMTGGAIAVSGAVMLTTGLTAMAGTSGYEDYKSALKATQALKSVSIQADAVLQDNGNVLNDAHGQLKVSLPDRKMSGNVQVTGKGAQQSVDLFSGPTGEVWKTGGTDTYFVKQDKQEKQDGEQQDSTENGHSAWMNKQAETVIDALVGNLKNYVSENSQSDGSKQISLQLDNAQIPAVVQALAPLAFKHLSGEHDGQQKQNSVTDQANPDKLFSKNLFNVNEIALTQDIQIQSVSLEAIVNAHNQIERQQASVTFTGKDAGGVSHKLTLNTDVHLSAFDQTTPDTIDLAGKKVQQVQEHQGHHNDSND